ncbi:hypothetical protein GCK32_005148 [Trichostrongylus colubriformis]|uniref:P-type phospholipid transporter n=1 Tax=Trichostrongylus colubriformis TaxID=6319 RepID=A0AAN8FKN3_TRICO
MRYSRLATSQEEADEASRLLPLMVDSEIAVDGSDDIYLLPSVSSRSSSTFAMTKCCRMLFGRRRVLHSRTVRIGYGPVGGDGSGFVPNKVSNQKYNIFSFVPLVLFQQFKFFLNLYFLLMACSQFIPAIQIGAPITYWGPLGFVLTITLIREALDDFVRFLRDKELNGEKYERLTRDGTRVEVNSSDIEVGDVIIIGKDRRVPADVVLLRTTERSGACFIRTDQLDGETDWKLRIAVPFTQHLMNEAEIMEINCEIYAEKPQKDIHAFVGTIKVTTDDHVQDGSLNVENVLWANTVLASGTAVGIVVYTGRETRSVMNTTLPESKVGLLDLEVNNLTKLLFVFVMVLASVMVIMKGLDANWYRYLMRFVLLFSYIIPISLRVNLDMAKLFFAWQIGRDKQIPDTVVRSSTIPEELGRISFLLSDKTGTLTKNEMHFKKIHLGTVSFGSDAFEEVAQHVTSAYSGRLARYSTAYTMLPVFSLVVDRDVTATNALTYPELYKELGKGRSLSYKTFCIWVMISLYQGAVIMYGALLVFDADFIHVVSISFSALIVTELIMVAMTVHTWHWAMLVAQSIREESNEAAGLGRVEKEEPAFSMGVCLTIACYLITFSPSVALFCRFIAKDSLRIILFVLGAFLWLASLLLCSFIWLAMSMVWDALPVAVACSIILQDAARVFYFWLLKKAQRGLNKITAPGASSIAPGVSDLHNARHMLALENKRDEYYAGPYLPLYYALTGCLASLFGVVWTIMIWDSCHRVQKGKLWALPALVATCSHFVVSGMSWFNSEGYQSCVLVAQSILLIGCIMYSQIIMGATYDTIMEAVTTTLYDWATLKWLRQKVLGTEGPFSPVEEIEADERREVNT